MAPLSSVPTTAPRRSSATSPAAIGMMICATTVVTPTRTLAPTRSPGAGAALAANSPSPVRASRLTISGRCGNRSPRGTRRKIPAAYPNCAAVTTSAAELGETCSPAAISGLIAWGK